MRHNIFRGWIYQPLKAIATYRPGLDYNNCCFIFFSIIWLSSCVLYKASHCILLELRPWVMISKELKILLSILVYYNIPVIYLNITV